MKNIKKKSLAWIIMFALIICGMGGASMYKLARYFILDEVDYNEWSADLGSKVETTIATTFFEKFNFVNLNGAIRNLLGQKEMNGVVKLNNGYLLTTYGYVDDDTIQSRADNVAVFNDYLRNRGTSLLFAMCPYTSSKYDPQLPTGIEDYGNDDADRLMEAIKEEGVDTLDFRDTMHEDGIDQYDMMYRTDHHWNTAAGLYAYGKLEDYIVEKTGCSIDSKVADSSNYTITTYKNWHLGSRGQRTGSYFSGADDFDLYIPKFDTLVQNDAGAVGSVPDIVYSMDALAQKDETSRYTYDSVLGNSLGHYINLNAKNDVKVLIITDSFGKAVNPYLMMQFAEIQYAYDTDVSGVTPDYIEAYDPDVVICMYYLGNAVENDSAFAFMGYEE